MSDNCPICTEGLRALLWLVEKNSHMSANDMAVRKLTQEHDLVSQRLEMAFGQPVDASGFDLNLRVNA